MAKVEVVRQALVAFEEQVAKRPADLEGDHERLHKRIGRALGYEFLAGKRCFSARTGDGAAVLEVDGLRFMEDETGELIAARFTDDGVAVFRVSGKKLVPEAKLPRTVL